LINLISKQIDCKLLVNGSSNVLDEKTVEGSCHKYNTENFGLCKTADGATRKLVCAHGEVSANKYLDPDTNTTFTVAHASQTITATGGDAPDTKLPGNVQSFRDAIAKEMATYVQGSYKAGKAVVSVYGKADGTITVCMSSENVNLSNFWSGGWHSEYTLNVSGGSGAINATSKLGIHYYEEGNVQLHNTHEKTLTVTIGEPEATGKAVAAAVNKFESELQAALEILYVELHTSIFKQMRRFLPISKTKMNWNSAGHAVASRIGAKK
jgi:capping protein alpha